MKNVFFYLVKAVIFMLCFAASAVLSYIIVDYIFPTNCEPLADLFGWSLLTGGLTGLTCICCDNIINRVFQEE